MNPILQALLAGANGAQARTQQPPQPSPLGFTSPFAQQPMPLPMFNSPMQDPQGDAWKQEQEAAAKAAQMEQLRQEIERTRMQMAETANRPVKRKPALDKKEALIGGGIAALAALLGARPQFLNPAIQQYIGAKEGQADQQYQQDVQAQQQAAAVLQAQLANQTDRFGDAQRSQVMEYEMADKRAQRATDLEKAKLTSADDLMRAQVMMGMLPYNQQLAQARAGQANATAGLTTEKATDIRETRPERQAKLKADRELAQTRAKSVLTGMKLDEARTAQILKDVEWADAEFASKIASREAMAQISRDRLSVTMRGQDMAQGRFDATQATKAQADHTKALKDLKSPVEKQIAKLEDERYKLNGKLAQALADENDDEATQIQRELGLNAARANQAAKKLYDIEKEMQGSASVPGAAPSTDPNAPANPFGGGMNLQGPIGGARGTTPRERQAAPAQKPAKPKGKVVRQGSIGGAKFTIREK